MPFDWIDDDITKFSILIQSIVEIKEFFLPLFNKIYLSYIIS